MANTTRVNARVISFSIAPLTDFCKNINRVLYEVDKADTKKVAEIFDDFNLMQQKLNNLKEKKFAIEYRDYNKILVEIGKFFLKK